MTDRNFPDQSSPPVVVVGAGIAGLAAAARLAQAGLSVTVLERHAAPGGKIRALPSRSGPVNTGPTVLTMRGVFDDLFTQLGTRLEDHVTLHRQDVLARHFWPDGSTLDLYADHERSAAAVRAFAGARGEAQFRRFYTRARTLFDGFDGPVMQSATPSPARLIAHVARHPHLIHAMAPASSLAGMLRRSFEDPRLAQLFGRYATYVGGAPDKVPALMALIWQAEAAGVWVVEGGMTRLAQALADLAANHGATFRYNAHVAHIDTVGGHAARVVLADGTALAAQAVLFNGDPRALATGALGPDVTRVAPQTARTARSLSADVWAFAATPHGPDLAHHNVFFREDAQAEFDALAKGTRLHDPTLYVCAQDRGLPAPPPQIERFEIIANAPPLRPDLAQSEDAHACQNRTFQMLRRFGLRFDPAPGPDCLSTPQSFEKLFPATLGALYGQSPQGMFAAFQRPTARTPVKGLYLAGGGAHPGAGVPMATLSARHAAEAILSDQISTSTCPRTAMPGGMSTA